MILRSISGLVPGVLAVLCLFLSATPAGAQRGGSRSAKDVLAEISEKGDQSPDHLFNLLGQMRDEAGLTALQRATEQVRRPDRLRAAFDAFGYFRDAGDVEGQAIAFLVGRVHRAKQEVQQAATRGLTRLGEPAHDELRSIVERHKDAIVRATALGPLVPGLRAEASSRDLPLIVDNYRVPQTAGRGTAIETFRSFDDEAAMRIYEERLTDNRFPRQMKTAILEAVAPLEGAHVDRLLSGALDAKEPDVLFAALSSLKDRGRVTAPRKVERLVDSKDASVRRMALVVLARVRITDEDFQGDLLALARHKDPATRQGAAVGLAELRTPAAVEVLHKLLADPDHSVRAEALQQVGNLHRKESIPVLITRLGAEKGRLSTDVATVLRLLTGLDHGRTPARWQAWWQAEGDAFVLPDYDRAVRAERERQRNKDRNGTAASFYGLQVVSDRVCFVLDISGSMQGGKIEAAKRELSGALEKYPEGDLFNIVFYATDVFPWQDELLPMNRRNRSASLDYVDRQQANGATAIFDALEAAFEDELIDTIFLLSDGQPTAGRITDPGQIRTEIGRWNTARKVKIHCIALGMDNRLLRDLANDSGGEYRMVR